MVPIDAVKAWLGRDVQAALAALESVPLKVETHAHWMEVRRNLLNAQKTMHLLERLAGWAVLGEPSELPDREHSGS